MHPDYLDAEIVLPFIPHGAEIDQEKDKRFQSLCKVICECTSIQSAATHVMETEPWDFMAVYFDAIDHFCHGFMKYHPPQRPGVSDQDFKLYQQVVSAGYVYHDMMLGRLVDLAGPETTVMVVSDHGFHPDHLRPERIPSEPAGPAAEHRDLGMFLMSGPGVKKDELVHGATLLDITPTILAFYGLPVGEDMDGRALTDAFEDDAPVATIPTWDDLPGEDGGHGADRKMSEGDSKELLDQLADLGYIDKPQGDQSKQVENTQIELDYNLARAYMDGGLHGEAAPILARLYRLRPLEFRFGIKLAVCLQALGRMDDLARLIDDLEGRWKVAAEKARERLREIGEEGRRRRAQRMEAREKGEAVVVPPPADEPHGHDHDDDDAVPPDDPVGETETDEGPLFEEAEMHVIRKLRGIAAGNPRTLHLLAAAVAVHRGDAEKAIEHAKEATRSATEVPGFHIQLGSTFLALKMAEEAEASYQRAIDLDSENAAAFLGLARARLRRKHIASALEAATKAVALNYHFPPAHHFRGVALARQGRHEEAVAELLVAVEQNPMFPEAHGWLARLYTKRLGEPEKATEHLDFLREIRAELRRRRRRKTMSFELPQLDDVAFDAQMPQMPKPPERPDHFVASLFETPDEEEKAQAGAADGFVTVVAGQPRSGTSMMMQMLAAGGMQAHTDDERGADASNPRGYFEHERVKRLRLENDWLDDARGRVLKVVTPLLPALAQRTAYRVILMDRDLDEVMASQVAMLDRLGKGSADRDLVRMRTALAQQSEFIKTILAAHDVPFLEVSHRATLKDPAATAAAVHAFLGGVLDVAAMASAVDPTLHRERAGLHRDRAGKRRSGIS